MTNQALPNATTAESSNKEENASFPQSLQQPPPSSITATITEPNPWQNFLHAIANFFSDENAPRDKPETHRHHRKHLHHHHHHKHHPKRSKNLLEDCTTVDEHNKKIQSLLKTIKPLRGEQGLKAMGLEYRLIPCHAHLNQQPGKNDDNAVMADLPETNITVEECSSDDDDDDSDGPGRVFTALTALSNRFSFRHKNEMADSQRSLAESLLVESATHKSHPPPSVPQVPHHYSNRHLETNDELQPQQQPCHWCKHRLVHVASGVVLDEDNRKRFVADGELYEEVARLSQEYAHDWMCQENGLVWHTINDETAEASKSGPDQEPLRILINQDHPLLGPSNTANNPTLVIVTGRGKVRAGIFSRQHLMCTSLECASAIPMIREACARNIHVLVLDPNVHGEANGFVTFQKSMDYYFDRMEEIMATHELLMLSHSASGGHLARYLLDRSHRLLAHVRAVAFTDSTHNIQWTKNAKHKQTPSKSLFAATPREDETEEDEEGNSSELQQLLESEQCVYFRCANIRTNGTKWDILPAGEPVQTDAFWKHRFGKIRTFWAGTDEHSLTNWYAHGKIWEHFDEHLSHPNTCSSKLSSLTE